MRLIVIAASLVSVVSGRAVAQPSNVYVSCEAIVAGIAEEQPLTVAPAQSLGVVNTCGTRLLAVNVERRSDQQILTGTDSLTSFNFATLDAWDEDADRTVQLMIVREASGGAPERAIGIIRVQLLDGGAPERLLFRRVPQAPVAAVPPAPPAPGVPVPPPLPPPATCESEITVKQSWEIEIDRTGVASVLFLNPRAPQYVGPPAECLVTLSPEQILQYLSNRSLIFRNRTADRTLKVTIAGIALRETAELERLKVPLQCDKECTAIITVNEGVSVPLPVSALWPTFKEPDKSLVTFNVLFFQEETAPANSRGYFTIVTRDKFKEPGNTQKWTASALIAVANDLDMNDLTPADDKAAVIKLESFDKDGKPEAGRPRDGANRSHLSGGLALGVGYTLGTRASAEVELQIKDGDFSKDPAVKPSKYRLNINYENGLVLSAGKFPDVMSPSFGVAIREAGEGVVISHPSAHLQVAGLFRKQVPRDRFHVAVPTDPLDRNHRALAIQASPLLPFIDGEQNQWGFLNAYLVVGSQERQRTEVLGTPAQPNNVPRSFGRNYSTIGAEFGASRGLQLVTAAFYRSKVASDAPASLALPGDDGTGRVAVLSYKATWLKKPTVGEEPKIGKTLLVLFGRGSGDVAAEPGATDDNEGYIGESANFTPDVLFLSKLAPLIDTTERLRVDGAEVKIAHGQVGKGLVNKYYLGGSYTQGIWSPLGALARWAGVRHKDVISESMTFKAHYYRFVQPVFDSNRAGYEVSADMKAEAPGGITMSVLGAYYRPGEALKRLITKDQWLLLGAVTVKM